MDYLVIIAYFAAILTIGLRMGRREKSIEGYALGNRSLPWWAILASILAAEISAATFLGAPGEGLAKRNFSYAQLAIGTVLGRIIVGKLFLKPYYDYNVVSIYEYLQKRFGTLTRRLASMTFLVTRLLASGTRLYVAGIILVIAVEAQLGHSLDVTSKLLCYVGVLCFITLLTAVYTTLGGIKAVVWTDVIQAAVLVIAIVTVLATLLIKIPGGWQGAMQALDRPDDLIFVVHKAPEQCDNLWQWIKGILKTEYTLWVAFIGSSFTTMATHGTDQDMVQRMLTGKDSRTGAFAVILSGIIDLPIVLLFCLTGILISVYLQLTPGLNPPANNPEIFPWFIIHQLPSGVRGLLVAGLLATTMGSLSTALNSLATSAVRDWYQDLFRPQATQQQLLKAVRWLSVVFAVLLVIVGSLTAWYVLSHEHLPMAQRPRIIPIVLGAFSFTYGALLGVFLLGMLTKKRGNDLGNSIAMLASFAFIVLLSFPPAFLKNYLPEVAFSWRIMLGTMMAFGVGMLFRHKKPTATPEQQATTPQP